MSRMVMFVVLCCFPITLVAAEPEVRTLFHYQGPAAAAWCVDTNRNAPEPRVLCVFGPAWRDTGKWVEAMSGVLVNAKTGKIDPMLNVRSQTSCWGASCYADAIYNFGTERTGISANVLVKAGRFRGGIDLDSSFGRGEPRLLVGPRLMIQVPCGSRLQCSVGGTYFFALTNGEPNFVRTYMPIQHYAR